MAAAEITLSAQSVLSRAIFIFLPLVLCYLIVVIEVTHVIVILIFEEVLIQVNVNFIFDLARLNFKKELGKFVHLCHHEVGVKLLKLLTSELKVKSTLINLSQVSLIGLRTLPPFDFSLKELSLNFFGHLQELFKFLEKVSVV